MCFVFHTILCKFRKRCGENPRYCQHPSGTNILPHLLRSHFIPILMFGLNDWTSLLCLQALIPCLATTRLANGIFTLTGSYTGDLRLSGHWVNMMWQLGDSLRASLKNVTLCGSIIKCSLSCNINFAKSLRFIFNCGCMYSAWSCLLSAAKRVHSANATCRKMPEGLPVNILTARWFVQRAVLRLGCMFGSFIFCGQGRHCDVSYVSSERVFRQHASRLS